MARGRGVWRSLTGRLALAFVALSVLTLGLVGAFSYAFTRAQFRQLLTEQVRTELVQELQTYEALHGSTAGFREHQGKGPPERSGPGSAPGGQDRPSAPAIGGPFTVLDAQYRPLTPSTGHVAGHTLPVAERQDLVPVPDASGTRTIAYLQPTGNQPPQDARSAAFLNSVARAVLTVMVVAAVLAVLTGGLLARTLLHPLRLLLRAIHAMQRGERVPRLPRTGPDELGEVLVAFNAMQDEVNRQRHAQRQLTADIAHDLNTPLSVIGGTLEGLLDGTFPPTPERLTRLQHETRHLTALVRDLRFLALADAGELRLTRERTPVGPLLRDATLRFQELADRAGVTLHATLPDPGPDAPVDPVRVVQVVQNLISNALTHTPPGGTVTLNARTDGASCVVSVHDTGPGIPADVLPHIFERLYRADPSRHAPGSGLGLSIARSIVEAHGGRVTATSTPGHGTTLTFTLPLQD